MNQRNIFILLFFGCLFISGLTGCLGGGGDSGTPVGSISGNTTGVAGGTTASVNATGTWKCGNDTTMYLMHGTVVLRLSQTNNTVIGTINTTDWYFFDTTPITNGVVNGSNINFNWSNKHTEGDGKSSETYFCSATMRGVINGNIMTLEEKSITTGTGFNPNYYETATRNYILTKQ